MTTISRTVRQARRHARHLAEHRAEHRREYLGYLAKRRETERWTHRTNAKGWTTLSVRQETGDRFREVWEEIRELHGGRGYYLLSDMLDLVLREFLASDAYQEMSEAVASYTDAVLWPDGNEYL